MDGVLREREKLFIIDEIPLFKDLSAKDKRLIARSSALVEYKKGDLIYREGDSADAFYCVITGRLKAFVAGRLRGFGELEYLKRGKYFGIISLLTGEAHSVTVQAVNDSIILKIRKEDFERILKHVPQLAIHLSRTLSRRLRRRDLHEKRVFESTIISVYGAAGKIGKTDYAMNLAVSIRMQTSKEVVLLDISRQTAALSILDSPFFNEDAVKSLISKHPSGIDLIAIPHKAPDADGVTHIIPLLTYLTNDYHFVVADLPAYMDKTVFESLKQSDVVHLVTAADEDGLRSTGRLITELEKSSGGIGQKIKVITTEYGVERAPDYEKRTALLGREIYATLPDTDRPQARPDGSKTLMVSDHPDCEYSKAVRRISREIGDCLIGLALGSGAALGLAHIGILKVIEKEGVPVDMVAGTSMGALIGALWASGKKAAEIEGIISEFRRRTRTLALLDLTLPKRGLIKGREVRRFLRSQFGDRTFYDLRMPLKIVCCDIARREEAVLEKGSLVDAVMASVSIPGVFEPVMIDGHLLVDGGIINPLPTNVLMRLGVAKIIASNALPSPEDIQKSSKKVTNIFDIIVNSVQASEYLLAEMSCQNVDLALHPVLPTVDWYEFYEGSRVIRRGEEEALRYAAQLRDLSAAGHQA